MIREGYDAFDDPYCYKGTATLRNRLGLRDQAQLEQFELEMATLRATEPLPDGRLDPAHYRRIHRHLFQDVYAWAGKYRHVRTSKGGNPFCFPEHIEVEMERLFQALHHGRCLAPLSAEAFLAGAAEFLGELNAIHPFREGNGRAQLSLMHLIGLEAGHPFDFGRIRPETFMPAMIASYDRNLEPLISELAGLLA